MKPEILLVVQPSLSHYRESFLRELLKSENVEFSLAGRYSEMNSSDGEKNVVNAASEELRDITRRLERRKVVRQFFWDKNLFSLVVRKKFELVILEGNFYNLSTWLSALLLKILGRKVAFWGHGWKRSDEGLKLKLRLLFYRIPDGHFVYGDKAADYAESLGFSRDSWHVIYNSLYSINDMEHSHSNLGKECDTLRLIFSGRLTKRHGVDLLIQAVVRLRKEEKLPIELYIVGDGDEFDSLTSLVDEEGDAIIFLGAQHDFLVLKDMYSKSNFAVSPGASGLNVIQALSFGVPVVAGAGDPQSGPEIEAVKDGETGLLFEFSNIQSLMDKLRHAHRMSMEERTLMAQSGRKLAIERYNAEYQAKAMLSGISGILTV